MSAVVADIRPLRESAHFRRLWVGITVGQLGQQMTNVAVAYQVWSLSRSSFPVGLLGAAAVVPMIVFGLYGGTLVDSFDRRRVAIVASTGLWLLSIVLVVQAALDLGQLWLLYVVVAGQAACFAVNNPARQAIVPRLIRSELLPSANALSTLSFSLGFTVGPLAGGYLLAVSGEFTLPYAVDAVTYLAALYALWRLPPVPPQGPPRAAGFRSMLEGFGWLYRIRRQGLAILVCVLGYGASIATFGLVGSLWIGVLFLALSGAFDMVSAAFRSTILQVAAPDEMRGRLQGVFVVVVAGGPRLGDLAAGSLGAIIGPTLAVVVGGCACMVATTLLAVRFRGFARYDAHAPQ